MYGSEALIHFFNSFRMAGKKEKELNENIKALEKNIELVDGVEMKNKILQKVAAISNQENDLEML